MQVLVCIESSGDAFEHGEQLFMTSMSPIGSAFATNKKGIDLTFLPAPENDQFYCPNVGGSLNDPKYLFELQES